MLLCFLRREAGIVVLLWMSLSCKNKLPKNFSNVASHENINRKNKWWGYRPLFHHVMAYNKIMLYNYKGKTIHFVFSHRTFFKNTVLLYHNLISLHLNKSFFKYRRWVYALLKSSFYRNILSLGLTLCFLISWITLEYFKDFSLLYHQTMYHIHGS